MAYLANDQLAEACRRHPDRFSGLTAVAPQDPADAAVQIERRARELGLVGGRGSPVTLAPPQTLASHRSVQPQETGGVPCMWNDSIVFRPQAWPLARSASVQVIVRQSGASTSRAAGLASSIRLPPGS